MSDTQKEEPKRTLQKGTDSSKHKQTFLRGRVGRLSYFIGLILFFIPTFVVLFLIGLLAQLFGVVEIGASINTIMFDSSRNFIFLVSVFLLLQLPLTMYSYNSMIRRLHDLNRPGWLITFDILLYIGLLLAVRTPLLTIAIGVPLLGFRMYLLFAPGTKGANKYGSPSTRLL